MWNLPPQVTHYGEITLSEQQSSWSIVEGGEGAQPRHRHSTRPPLFAFWSYSGSLKVATITQCPMS